jgi:hypothetical protein
MKVRISSIAATLLTVLLAGCVAQSVNPTPTSIASQVRPGDRIRVVTVSGSEEQYRVVRLDNEALYVKVSGHEDPRDPEQRIAYSDIRELSRTRAPANPNTAAGLAAATIAAGAAFLWAMEYAAAAALCC